MGSYIGSYFGTYQKFDTVSKKAASALMGADNLVGDFYDISIEMEEGVHKAWLVNRFDQQLGFFDPRFSRELSVYKARNFTIKAILSFIAYSDKPEPGCYWGQMAVICYDPTYEKAFDLFAEEVSTKMQDGTRLDLDLSQNSVDRIIESDGEWLPDATVPAPSVSSGTVIVKSKRSFSEKMVEQGRKGNKGCYAVSIIFLVVVVVVIVLILRACGVF